MTAISINAESIIKFFYEFHVSVSDLLSSSETYYINCFY